MRKGLTIALSLLAAAGFWIVLGDTSPATRPSPSAELAIREERDFRARLRQSGRIVFTREAGASGASDVWIMDGDGSRQSALTTSGLDRRPVWSADGTRIAFVRRDRERDDAGTIYLLDLSGGPPRKLSDTVAVARGAPCWSPDDRFIAFTHPARDESVLHCEVRVVEVATGRETFVGHGEHPSWSPDGRLVASVLGIVDPASESAARVPIPEGDDFTWSPDGRQIAFLRAVRGGATGHALATLDAEGSLLRMLTRHDRIDQTPAWSPDGRRLAFHSVPPWDALGRDVLIHVVEADEPAGRSLGRGTDPRWTPDGTGLIFAAPRGDDGPSQIWYVDAEGTRRTNLSQSDASDREPRIHCR
jgi:Tol biopolymer transport system component